MKKTSSPLYADILSIISVAAVIIVSVISLAPVPTPVGSIKWTILTAVRSVLQFAIPVIIMIFGMRVLSVSDSTDFDKSCLRIALRLLIAVAFWSLLYAAFDSLFLDGGSLISCLKGYILNTIKGKNHLWLIFVLVGLCIVSPLLKKITANKSTLEYFLIIWFIFTICGNILLSIPNSFINFKKISEMIHMSTAINFSGYFCLGYYLGKYDIKKSVRAAVYIVGTISVAFFVAATYYFSVKEGKVFDTFYKSGLPITAFIPSTVFILVRSTLGRSGKSPAVIAFWSKLTFGIYLCHIAVLNYLLHSAIIPKDIHTTYWLILAVTATYFISLVLSAIPNLIPFCKKYFV